LYIRIGDKSAPQRESSRTRVSFDKRSDETSTPCAERRSVRKPQCFSERGISFLARKVRSKFRNTSLTEPSPRIGHTTTH
uniref:Uncharacterized protein n=1 Tax=Haemonchus placei TaxID=6290 RepID=A0A158QM05_HAEPC